MRTARCALAAAIARKERSAAEVLESYLERIVAVNPEVNAITRLFTDPPRGEEGAPLAGVPFTVKENIDVAGEPTTQGVPALAKAVAGWTPRS